MVSYPYHRMLERREGWSGSRTYTFTEIETRRLLGWRNRSDFHVYLAILNRQKWQTDQDTDAPRKARTLADVS